MNYLSQLDSLLCRYFYHLPCKIYGVFFSHAYFGLRRLQYLLVLPPIHEDGLLISLHALFLPF